MTVLEDGAAEAFAGRRRTRTAAAPTAAGRRWRGDAAGATVVILPIDAVVGIVVVSSSGTSRTAREHTFAALGDPPSGRSGISAGDAAVAAAPASRWFRRRPRRRPVGLDAAGEGLTAWIDRHGQGCFGAFVTRRRLVCLFAKQASRWHFFGATFILDLGVHAKGLRFFCVLLTRAADR